MTISRPLGARGAFLALCALVATCAAPTAVSASQSGPTVPPALAHASTAATRSDRTLVYDAKAFKACVHSHSAAPAYCNPARRAVQRAGSSFARAERQLARIARATGRAGASAHSANARNPRLAPRLVAFGKWLRWSRVANVGSYVVMREVPGQGQQYVVVRAQWFTPPPVPGVTVRYKVRTAVRWSAWSPAQSISYPPSGTTNDAQAAPALAVAGATLSWSQVAGVTTYVLATKVPGQPDRYSEVTGTSVTPAPVAGDSVHYSVRTAVEGSAWAPEVAVRYSAATPPAQIPAPQPAPAPAPSGGPFEVGAVVGSNAMYELPWLIALKAHTARIEVPINSTVAQLEPMVEAYARAGIRPLLLAGFNARMPSTAEAQNLASWAQAFGPGGSTWRAKGLPAGTEVTQIEFGNETNNPWQYLGTTPSNWYVEPAFLARAEEYARRLRDAQVAISQTGVNVGLLGIADQYSGYTTWVNAMFNAVPDLGQRVAGWTVHPYGPNWRTPIDTLIADTQAHGAPSTIPIYATEWGLTTDNGRCLDNNFGFNPCMSYQEAASTLSSTVEAMRSRYGNRLRALYIFQARDQQPSGSSQNRESYFGALQSNMAPKGAYTDEVQSLLTANP